MLVNQAWLRDADVRTALGKMAQVIILHAKVMTTQANRQEVQQENPPAHNMANMLRDFMRMNPSIFTRSKIVYCLQEFVEEVQKIFVAMGDTEIEKDKLFLYQLKDVAQAC